jgi:hypothetical protein
VACTDWKAVAAFDAAEVAVIQVAITAYCSPHPAQKFCDDRNVDSLNLVKTIEQHRDAAIADKCQENAR